MIIDFNSMPVQVLPNFKGGKKEISAQMYWDGETRILHATLVPGASIGQHTHEGNCEFIFVVKGTGIIIEDGTETPITAGQCTYCPNGHSHSLVNTGTEDIEFYAAVPKQ